jgi:hypothetical protein
MIDIPHVFKLGKGPEQGHVNCSLFYALGPGPTILDLSSYEDVIKFTGKMSHMSVSNYLDLHLSDLACIVRYINYRKEKNSWHMT